jgi:hypothetical protein
MKLMAVQISSNSWVFYILLTVHPCIILKIKSTWCTIPSFYVYLYSLHVSGNYVPIIRWSNSINVSGICHSVWMAVWYAGCYAPCIPDGHPHRVTNNRCTDTVISPADEHIVARNMYRREINTQRRICEPGCFYLQNSEYLKIFGVMHLMALYRQIKGKT